MGGGAVLGLAGGAAMVVVLRVLRLDGGLRSVMLLARAVAGVGGAAPPPPPHPPPPTRKPGTVEVTA